MRCVWDLNRHESLLGLRGHDGWPRAIAIDDAGRRIVSSDVRGVVRVWDW